MSLKIFFSSAFLLFSTSMVAQEGQIDFSYAGNNVESTGNGKNDERYNAAICIDEPAYTGAKIVGITAYISGIEGIDETSVWMSDILDVNDKTITANILKKDVSPEEGKIGELSCGVLKYELETPYELTGSPVYIGYSLHVTDNVTDIQKYPLLVSPGDNSNGYWLYATKSMAKWVNYQERTKSVLAIVVQIEGNFPEASLSISGAQEGFIEKDKPFNLNFEVINLGGSPVENISYTYSINGQSNSNYLDLENPVPANPAQNSIISLPFEGISEIGLQNLTLSIDKINGENNESEFASIVTPINILPYIPINKPLVEEYTGLWCGYCPRGYIGMELLGDKFKDDVVIICYHNDDALEVTRAYPYPANISNLGLPVASVDRYTLLDPYYGTYNNEIFGISKNVEEYASNIAIAEINIDNAYLDEDEVIVKSTVNFVIDKEDADYSIGYVLVENGMENSAWLQVNYYSGLTTDDPNLEILTTWPSNVRGLQFNDVAIDVTAMNGIKESIPSTVKIGTSVENEFSFDLSGNKVLQNKENLVVAAFIIDNNTKNIVNANKSKVYESAAVESIDNSVYIIDTNYYDLNGRKVISPSEGIFIKVEKASDGSVKRNKVIIKN